MTWEILGDSVEGNGEEFSLSQTVRRQHTYVLGRTGSGKSTLLTRLALADIERGDGLLVLDPHGDLVEDIIAHCPQEHLDRIIYVDPADREHPVPLNLFECRPTDDKDTVCSEVIGVFKRLFGESWGFRLEDLLRNLTLAMLDHQFLGNDAVPVGHRYNATLKEAHDFLFNQQMRREYYSYLTNSMVRDFWIQQYDNMGALRPPATVTHAQITYSSSVTNKLRRFLLNTLVFDIVANRDVTNTIDLRTAIANKSVLLVNLSKGKLGEENSALLGSIWLSRLVVAALSRADTPERERAANVFHVIADEFQAFATDSFKLLLSEARKYGITLTIAHQHREQLDQEMKGAALNCGSLLCFRVAGRDAVDVGREFDSTPRQTGFKMERGMELHQSSLSQWANETFVHSPVWGPVVARIVELREEMTALANRIVEVRNNEGRLKHATDCEKTNHQNCDYRLEPTIAQNELSDELARVSEEYLPRLDELSAEISRLEDSLPNPAAEGLGGYWASSDTEVGNYRTGGYESEHPLTGEPYWVPHEYVRGEIYNLYRRVPQFDSFGERERQIANALTQLPNFRAMYRLADATSGTISSRALPTSSRDRAKRIAHARNSSRNNNGIKTGRRASQQQEAYLSSLRRQEAYEAELEDQPRD